jgi:hypothetical protein
VDDALALFGNSETRSVVLLKPDQDYRNVYQKVVADLSKLTPPGVGDKWRAAKALGDENVGHLTDIQDAIAASPTLRNKHALIMAFVEAQSVSDDVGDDWQKFVHERRETELEALIAEEALKPEQTRTYMADAFPGRCPQPEPRSQRSCHRLRVSPKTTTTRPRNNGFLGSWSSSLSDTRGCRSRRRAAVSSVWGGSCG